MKIFKNRITALRSGIQHVCQSGYCRLQAKTDGLLQHENMRSPLSRKIFAVSFAVTTLGLAAARPAYADDGIAGVFSTGADQASSVKSSAGTIFMCIGVFFAAVGVKKWFDKGGEHGQSVKAGHIYIPIIAGVGLGALGYVMRIAGETVGVSDSDYGDLPG